MDEYLAILIGAADATETDSAIIPVSFTCNLSGGGTVVFDSEPREAI